MKHVACALALAASGISTGCAGLVGVHNDFKVASVELKVDNATDGVWLPQVNNRLKAPVRPGEFGIYYLSLRFGGWLQDPYRGEAPAPIGGKLCGAVVRVRKVAEPLTWTQDPRFGQCAIEPAWLANNPPEWEVRERIACIKQTLRTNGELGRAEKSEQLDRWFHALQHRGVEEEEWDCDPAQFQRELAPIHLERHGYRYGMSAERRLIVLRGRGGSYEWVF